MADARVAERCGVWAVRDWKSKEWTRGRGLREEAGVEEEACLPRDGDGDGEENRGARRGNEVDAEELERAGFGGGRTK